jgi:DNA-binding transcriptional ArsR family regulator
MLGFNAADEACQARVFAALADATRRELLVHLTERGPQTATQLAREFPITRQAVLKHLDTLKAAGLVTVRQQGREKRYTPTLEPLTALEAWITALSEQWDQRLLRLKALVEAERKKT